MVRDVAPDHWGRGGRLADDSRASRGPR
ncbi:4-oxalocrotonate tautomerase family protein [Streptomyces albidoflavus]